MAKIVRTPSGAFFEDTGSGYTAVSDPRTIQALRSGQMEFSNVDSTSGLKFAGSSPETTPPRTLNFEAGDNSASMPDVQTNQPTGNPLEIFNSNIQGLLKLYQNAPTSEQEYKNLYKSQQEQASQGFMPMDESLIGASPSELQGVRNSGIAMYEPEQNAIKAKIQADQDRIDRFLNLVEVAKDFGVEYAKAMPMDDATAKSMLSLLGSGKEFDGEMVKSLLSSPYAKNNPEAVNEALLAYDANKNKPTKTGATTTTITNFATNPLIDTAFNYALTGISSGPAQENIIRRYNAARTDTERKQIV
jgi:hypothetical protein